MICILKKTLKIIAVSLLGIVAASKVFAMEEEARMQAARSAGAATLPDQSSAKQVTAAERLVLIIEHSKDLTFTKNTRLSALSGLYARDLAFIKAAVSSRRDKKEIIEGLDVLDGLVRREGLNVTMSCDHYAKIGSLWACILSPGHLPYDPKRLARFFVPFLRASSSDEVLRIISDLDAYDIHVEYAFVGSPYPAIPHVSRTGAVPIPVINRAHSFFRDLEFSMPYSVDFIGVGTNEHLSYDGVREKDAFANFEHDVIHILTANKTNAHPTLISAEALCRKAAHLKCILTANPLPKEEEARRQLALFNIFHEGEARFLEAITGTAFGQYLQDEIVTFRKQLDRKEMERTRYDRFNHQTKILAAQSLNLPIIGETFDDQVASYYSHLIAAYEGLLPFADVFDRN